MGDLFDDLSAKSNEFRAGWSKVASQLSSEGASDLDVVAAQQAMATAFSQITSDSGFGLSSTDALTAAQDFTIAGRTVLGAVDHVQGLIAAAQGSDPTQVFQMFTGTMIGLAVTTGALSAGIGSVIVVGVGAALSLMKAAGLFGSPPAGQEICPGFFVSPPPSLVVGCVGSNATAVKSGSPFWRSYPKRAGGNTNDAQWFGNATNISWSGSSSPGAPAFDWGGYSDRRLIDSAFPLAHYLACQSVPSSLADFSAAFLSAWTANAEYALNGLKPQPDWQVLQHLVKVWNRAHSNASTVDVAYVPRPAIGKVSFDALGKVVGPCPANLPPYFATLVADLVANSDTAGSQPIVTAAGAMRINTGPIVTAPKRTIVLKLPPKVPAPSSSTDATPWTAGLTGSSATTAIVLTSLAVAGAGAFYAYRQKKRRSPLVPKALRAKAQRLRRALHR